MGRIESEFCLRGGQVFAPLSHGGAEPNDDIALRTSIRQIPDRVPGEVGGLGAFILYPAEDSTAGC